MELIYFCAIVGILVAARLFPRLRMHDHNLDRIAELRAARNTEGSTGPREDADRHRRSEPEDNDARFARILGLSGEIDGDLIKRKWRERSVEYHPDKVSHLGPKLKEVAEREMKEINEAYEYFRNKYRF